MERVWFIIATLCLIAAAFFLWRALAEEEYINAAFVAASLGVVAWFLRLRIQIKRTIPPSEDVPADDEEETDNIDED